MFPVAEDVGGGFGGGGAEDVGVPANHFVVDFTDYGRDVEATFFVGDLRVEENLEEKVAEFLGEFGVVGGVQGIEHFVGFLDQVGAEGGVSLLAVPEAAVGRAKAGHDGDKFLEVGADLGRSESGVLGSAEFCGFAFGFVFGFARAHESLLYGEGGGFTSRGGRETQDPTRNIGVWGTHKREKCEEHKLKPWLLEVADALEDGAYD